MNEHKYRLVNWVEGMDVNHTMLQQQENYFLDRLCDNLSTRLTRFNFGLLPSPDGHSNSSEFDISEAITGKVEISLRRCNAITSGGCRIAYNPAQADYMLYTHSFAAEKEKGTGKIQHWDVILSVDPFRRVPVGIPNEDEYPPRHPDVSEFYHLSVVRGGKINHDQLGGHHLVIGRIRQTGNRYEVDTDYIPPCTNMRSHPGLMAYYERFGRCMNDLERASTIIITKIGSRDQNSPLAMNINMVCIELMRHISSMFFLYRNTGRDMAPVYIVDYFSTMAHICFNALNFIRKPEKEELLKYLYEWSDVTPGTFEELLAGTLNLPYDHNSIRSVMVQVESFMQLMSELWTRLSSLEYIGQHKENIVVSERTMNAETTRAKSDRWTVLD